MNSWLRNIQGQLSELATEVLQEATTEVEDPETELQVEKKRCEEAERLLIVERSAAEALEQRVAELEHQLAFCNEENEAIKEKFQRMITSRDLQIKDLQTEIHSAEFHRGDSTFQTIDLDERTYVSAKSKSSESGCSVSDAILAIENRYMQEIAELKEKHEAEFSALMSVHADNVYHIRQEYESKIQELQNWSVADVSLQDDEKVAAQEKEISDLKSALDAVHDENRKTIGELRAQLLEKESELHKLQESATHHQHQHLPSFVAAEDIAFDASKRADDDEKRPPSVAGTDSAGSNNGWERMGTEYVGGVAGAPSSNSSSSGESVGKKEEAHHFTVDASTQHTATLKDSNELEELRIEKEELQRIISNHESVHDDYIKQIERLSAELQFKQERLDEMDEELTSHRENFMELETLRSEKAEFQRILANSKSEHENYTTNIERLSAELHSKQDSMYEIEGELASYKEKLASSCDQYEHLQKELNRLREVLVNMEDTSTRETSAAEEREAQLRAEILALQNRAADVFEGAQHSQDHSQDEISLLKEQLVASEENSAKLRSLLNEKEASLAEESKALSNLQQVLRELGEDQTQETSALENQITALRKENEEMQAALSSLRERESSLAEDQRYFEDSVALLKEELERKNAAIGELEKLRSEKAEFQRILADSESNRENYTTNVERLSAELHAKQDRLNEIEGELTSCRESGDDEREHLRKELGRLREHLLNMEDISTREAVAAEEREAQLRDEIRALQNHKQHFSESANQSQNQYQEAISLLKEQLVASEENSAKLRSLLNEKEASLAEESKALSNLQQVLRELGEDQTQETSALENQIKVLRKENEEVQAALRTLHERESSLVEDRRFFEDSVTLLKEELERKNAVVEELENQMEDLRHNRSSTRVGGRPATVLPSGDESPAVSDNAASDGSEHIRKRSSAVATYKIDDSTLKHLFFSYFIADKEKQPEIALVMASILGYSPEEQAAIQDAVNVGQGGGGGWFFGMGGGGGKRGGRLHAPSLTEQFIRFLEAESRALAEQPTLHIQGDSGSPASGGQGSVMLTDVTQLPAAGSISHHSNYSSSDLKSILESKE